MGGARTDRQQVDSTSLTSLLARVRKADKADPAAAIVAAVLPHTTYVERAPGPSVRFDSCRGGTRGGSGMPSSGSSVFWSST